MRTCNVKAIKNFNAMNGSHEAHVIGIRLIPDGLVAQIDNRSLAHCDGIIGAIICSNLSMLVKDFRDHLVSKISHLPIDFRFLSQNGWPIERAEETNIEVVQLINSNLVTIQRDFGIPRLGVRWYNGEFLGFIFVNFNSYLSEVREVVSTELAEKFEDVRYEFLDKNRWPVSSSQENKLTAWDICVENYFNIIKVSTKRKIGSINHRIKRPSKLNSKSYKLIQKSDIQTHPNSILISYVHGEATTHARDLKDELVNMGLESVFLDVDDIPAGRDWQDVINTALYNCSAFVALVTPRYGETRWTNREAKLADDKEKLIIPVSFLEKWPPDQLAIQFLSLQYIPWKTPDEFASAEGSSTFDIAHWDQRCVHRVAKEIKKLCTEQDVSTPDSISLIDSRAVNDSPGNMFAPAMKHGNDNEDNIVISAHSQQKDFVEKMANMLKEERYNVWSSTDVTESYGSFDDSQQSEYSPIIESYTHIKSNNENSLKISRQNSICNFRSDCGGDDSLQCSRSEFKRKVKGAKLVILVISEAYNKCRLCLQQAFYCEQRRKVVAVKYGKFQIDNIILNLYPEQDILQNDDEKELFNIIKQEVAKKLKENTSMHDRIQIEVMNLKQQINSDNCVYVIGGTSCVSKNAELFSVALGTELAKIADLTLITEGFFGAGDFVGKNFCEEREILAKGQPHSIYHVIPHQDSKNFNKRARQKDDGSFEKIPYGQTIFYGNSVLERDEIVSAAFKICILIEGGERSARLAEKFLWNDCTVVPVLFNNRAITDGGCLSACISKVPCGVNSADWCGLNNSKNNPDDLAKMVKKIICTLLRIRNKERKNLL